MMKVGVEGAPVCATFFALAMCVKKLQFLDFEPCIAPFSLPSVLWTERFEFLGV